MSEKEHILVDVRCSNCEKLLAKLPKDTDYQIKCPRCGLINERKKENGIY